MRLLGVPARLEPHHDTTAAVLNVAVSTRVLCYYSNVLEGAQYQPVTVLLLGHRQDSLIERNSHILLCEGRCHDIPDGGGNIFHVPRFVDRHKAEVAELDLVGVAMVERGQDCGGADRR